MVTSKVLSLLLKGTSGLLQCSSASMENVTPGVNKPTPAEDALRRLNSLVKAGVEYHVHPTSGFKSALVEAGKSFKETDIGGKSRQAGASKHISRSFYVIQDPTTLLDPDTLEPLAVVWQNPDKPEAPHSVRIDRRMGVLKTVMSKPAIMVARPLIPRWAAIVEFSFPSDDFFGPIFFKALTEQIVRNAGLFIGAGSYRPQVGGPFGRFELANWALDGEWKMGDLKAIAAPGNGRRRVPSLA